MPQYRLQSPAGPAWASDPPQWALAVSEPAPPSPPFSCCLEASALQNLSLSKADRACLQSLTQIPSPRRTCPVSLCQILCSLPYSQITLELSTGVSQSYPSRCIFSLVGQELILGKDLVIFITGPFIALSTGPCCVDAQLTFTEHRLHTSNLSSTLHVPLSLKKCTGRPAH